MEIIFDLALIAGIFLFAYYILGIVRGAPFVPTHRLTVEQMLDAAGVRPDDRVVDLGSGDGRIVIAAARRGAAAEGYEINPLLVLWSAWRIRRAGLTALARVHWKSFWREDLSGYSVVTLFGVGGIMKPLEQKLQRELRPGARVVSHAFSFPTWPGEKLGAVHLYRKQ